MSSFVKTTYINIKSEKMNSILEAVRIGVPIKYAFDKAGVPVYFYYKWLKLYNAYIKEQEELDNDCIDELQELEPSVEYKDKDGNTTGKRYTPISFIENIKMAYADFVIDTHKKISLSEDKDDWKAPAWLLERRVKDEYAKEETVNQNNTEKVESINIVYRDPSEDKDRIEKLAQEVKDAINV